MITLSGMTLGGYRIDQWIGSGGMGDVFHGTDIHSGRSVAIKRLHDRSADSATRERLRNEARIHARLYHPHIATLYDVLETADGPCLVMEYVPGLTIAERLSRHGPFPPADALRLFGDVVRAVAYLHSDGIIHRDLKPQNIKVTPDGRAKLLDFGIAWDVCSQRLTAYGGIVGTLQYLAPEQLTGRTVDTSSDVWSLGVLLYEMLAGHPPFDGKDAAALLVAVEKTGYVPLRHYDPDMPTICEWLVDRCLRRRPGQRFANAGAIAAALAASIDAPTLSAPAVPAGGRLVTLWRKWWGLWRLPPAVAVPMAVTGIALFAATLHRPNDPEPMILTAAPVLQDAIDIAATTPQRDLETIARARPEAPAVRKWAPVRIGSRGSPIEIYREGRFLGMAGTRPITFNAEVGSRVVLLLRRQGEKDRPVAFTVLEHSNSYDY